MSAKLRVNNCNCSINAPRTTNCCATKCYAFVCCKLTSIKDSTVSNSITFTLVRALECCDVTSCSLIVLFSTLKTYSFQVILISYLVQTIQHTSRTVQSTLSILKRTIREQLVISQHSRALTRVKAMLSLTVLSLMDVSLQQMKV